MSKKEFTVNIRGDDDLDIRGECRRIGEASGWKVEEQRGFDEGEGKMVTRQVYSQEFDDPRAGEMAFNRLEEAIKQSTTLAVVICPEAVAP